VPRVHRKFEIVRHCIEYVIKRWIVFKVCVFNTDTIRYDSTVYTSNNHLLTNRHRPITVSFCDSLPVRQRQCTSMQLLKQNFRQSVQKQDQEQLERAHVSQDRANSCFNRPGHFLLLAVCAQCRLQRMVACMNCVRSKT